MAEEQTLPFNLRRQIARTRVSERVRRVIAEHRFERFQIEAAIEDDGEVSELSSKLAIFRKKCINKYFIFSFSDPTYKISVS